jgi:hypothetical protein
LGASWGKETLLFVISGFKRQLLILLLLSPVNAAFLKKWIAKLWTIADPISGHFPVVFQ